MEDFAKYFGLVGEGMIYDEKMYNVKRINANHLKLQGALIAKVCH